MKIGSSNISIISFGLRGCSNLISLLFYSLSFLFAIVCSCFWPVDLELATDSVLKLDFTDVLPAPLVVVLVNIGIQLFTFERSNPVSLNRLHRRWIQLRINLRLFIVIIGKEFFI